MGYEVQRHCWSKLSRCCCRGFQSLSRTHPPLALGTVVTQQLSVQQLPRLAILSWGGCKLTLLSNFQSLKLKVLRLRPSTTTWVSKYKMAAGGWLSRTVCSSVRPRPDLSRRGRPFGSEKLLLMLRSSGLVAELRRKGRGRNISMNILEVIVAV